MRTQRALSEIRVIVLVTLLPCATAFATAQERDSSSAKANERRFSVVHAHVGNNCAGYLYVSQESVRYEAMVPPNFKDHSFQIQRAEILALQPWILMGQPQNIVEIKTARANYHFWVLPDGMDLSIARSRNLNLIAAPAAELIAAVRNPETALKKTTPQTPARAAEAGSEPSTRERGESTPADRHSSGSNALPDIQAEPTPPPGTLEGIYVGFSLDGSHMRVHNYYFTGDGWVINSIPFVDMDAFDLAAYRNDPSNKLFIGRYQVDGTQVRIVWANNGDRRDVIRFDNAAAEPGIDTYIPTCRCTGKRFAGRYHWASPTDERYVQFFPDGTFVDHGLTDQVVVPNPHGYSGITDPPRNFRGNYSISNQKLTFTFADGKRATVAFIAPKALEKAPVFGWFGLGHGSGVRGAETVIVLTLYEEHYQIKH